MEKEENEQDVMVSEGKIIKLLDVQLMFWIANFFPEKLLPTVLV